MKRREMLLTTGAAAVGLSMFPFGWTAAAEGKKQKVLYFTRSAGFEHSVVRRPGDELSHSEKVLTEMGKRVGLEVECSKDGRLFDGDLDRYDAIAFYTSGDLCRPESKRNNPPMSPEGKQRLLDAVAAGTGFVAFHAATDSFHSRGDRIDPYIAMVGGEFVTHGPQQEAQNHNHSPGFPGMKGVGRSITLLEEWYTLKNFADDLHVILSQETGGMRGGCYQRPNFPATWARKHDKGRVFYTSLGHREDIWTNETVQQIILGGFAWVLRNAEADVTPNIRSVTPNANQLQN